MKNNLLTLATVLTLGFFTNNANAQVSDTQSTNIGATIVSPISLASSGALQFGTIATDAIAGSVTLPSDGGARTLNQVTAVDGSSSIPTFTVTGTLGKTFTIELPSEDQVVKIGTSIDPKDKMVVNAFERSGTAGEQTIVDGGFKFSVGAKLGVQATGSQNDGVYTGTFNVTVNYN